MMMKLKPTRRVVTGHDTQGKAVVLFDSPVQPKQRSAGATAATMLWVTGESPVEIGGTTDRAETLAADQRREPSAQRQHDSVRDQVRSQHPGGLIHRGGKAPGNVRQGYVGDAGIQHLHERRQHHGQGDDPRIDGDTCIVAGLHGGCACYLVMLLLVIIVAFTFMPGRRITPSGSEAKTIFTGMRSTTLTKFPVAFSGGSRLMRAPVPPAMESTFPAMVRPYMSTSISAGWPG